MTELMTFFFIAIGVVLSIVLEPSFRAIYGNKTRGVKEDIWTQLKPYVIKLVASLIVAFGVMIVSYATGVAITTWWMAVLIGFGAQQGVNLINGNFRS